jgi:hypothetical protein
MNLTRRRLLMGGAAAVAGGAGVAWNAVTANAGAEQFDEIYAGRRIQGKAGAVDVLYVDGDGVHVMRNVDGSYTTSVNHYESFTSLREAAKRAVDTLGDLRPVSVARHSH